MNFPRTQIFVNFAQQYSGLQDVERAARRLFLYISNEPNANQDQVLQRVIALTTKDQEAMERPETQSPEYGTLRDECWTEIGGKLLRTESSSTS